MTKRISFFIFIAIVQVNCFTINGQSDNFFKWKSFSSEGILEIPVLIPNKVKKTELARVYPPAKPIIKEYNNFLVQKGKLKSKNSGFVGKLEVEYTGPLVMEITDLPYFSFKDYVAENIQYIDKAHGLFSNTIVSIEQDAQGYIWIGAENDGIIKIDGSRAWNIKKNGGLLSNVVYCLFNDSKNRMWVGTDKGLSYIENNKVYKIRGKKFEKALIKRIKEDKQGNIWVAVDNVGLFKISGNQIEEYSIGRGMFGKSIEDMYIDDNGEVNVVGLNGWHRIRGLEITFIRDKGENVYDFMPTCVQKIGDKVWLGGFSGSNFYWQGNQLYKVKLRNSYERCFQIEESRDGIWFADYAYGMILLKHDGTLKYYGASEGLAGRSSYHFKIDHNSNVWVADPFAGVSLIEISPFSFTVGHGHAIAKFAKGLKGGLWTAHNGTGINYLKDGIVYQYNTIGGTGKYTIDHSWDFFEEVNGTFWLSTHGMGVAQIREDSYDIFRFKEGNTIMDITNEDDGDLWFSTDNKGLRFWNNNLKEYRRFTTADGIASNFVKSSSLDHKGRLWVCTDEGVNIIYKNKIALLTRKSGLSSSDINFVFEDSKHRIWIATNDAGINLINGDSIIKFDRKNGLISDRVVKIFEDSKGLFWVITTSGLSQLKPSGKDKFLIRNFDYHYGSFMQDFYSGVFENDDGKIWFGTQQGMVEFNPEFVNFSRRSKFNVNQVWINNNLISKIDRKIQVKTNDQITVDFSVFDWGSLSQKNLYYALVKAGDSDTVWQEISTNKAFQFGKIKVGNCRLLFKYTFGGYNQYFSGPTFEIRNPWYKTIGFNLFLLILLIVGVRFVVIIRTKIIQNKRKELEKIVEQRTNELVQEKLHLANANTEIEKKVKEKDVVIYEMHHRVKNNLQTISSLIDMQMRSLKEERERSVLQDTVRRISAMSASHELLYASEDLSEICLHDFITHLLSLQERFIDHPDKKVNIINEIPNLTVNISSCIDLGMIISEAVSNAIKHAFVASEQPELRITAFVQNENCVLSISDNGIGIAGEKVVAENNTLGLRLMKIFASKLKGEISIENCNPGTRIEISFPINKK